ncbi:Mor transcription activator family protein [Geoalkalibacter sp.]|uniref:Mor transcription activator family protein n=1 Tax=Geoalkalibacter sp. TaxID=3041440 RepID=UPI00272DCA4C|nr:Mor transcription activator family protein [Geoalkalibacter sp.]
MTRGDNAEILAQLYDRLHREFGRLAPVIIQVYAEEVGGLRLTFPDLQTLYRTERNRRIRVEFDGANTEELAIKYRLKKRQVRRIVQET